MSLRGVWLTPGATVNRRHWAGRRARSKDPPNGSPSTAPHPPGDALIEPNLQCGRLTTPAEDREMGNFNHRFSNARPYRRPEAVARAAKHAVPQYATAKGV